MKTEKKGKVSFVLGSYNRYKFLKLAIQSIRDEIETSGLDAEIVVVDGGSNDGSLPWLVRQKDVILILQHNRGVWKGKEIPRRSWGYFMNLGFRSCEGEYICMISDDSLIVPGSIERGIESISAAKKKNPKIGGAAFYWRNWPEQPEYLVGLAIGKKIFVNHGLYTREAMLAVDFIDEDSFHFYHADGDLCLKMWHAGYEIIAAESSYVEHYSHANLRVRQSNNEKQQQDWSRYLQKWTGIFYFPNTPDEYEGGWLHKTYQDLRQTAFKFYKAISWQERIILFLKKIRKKFQ
ncbi:glycosyltransferase [Leptospira gomenensis]|uniref:Glycosyltransferase n=1 Tax=Leptospira gomenensis TaxID=2484974 RepID=A0A5F1YRU5_9LEPT|nr:glycosyltransferase [Leptospira gomenensis]TGK30905.1 glycosyltransferase [Leptospira gomenensis]TGK32543.1 glycosyltransferase [Leptospira gomenensis]TGK45375.1 glycosyltransferase [Leptospira gomenensis]TGK60633.1 glycosyltransferase [Leptospira gomenensis]